MSSPLPVHRLTDITRRRWPEAAVDSAVLGLLVAGLAVVLGLCALPAIGLWTLLVEGPDLDDARAIADTYLSRIERGDDAAAYGQICARVQQEVSQAAFTDAVEIAPRPRSHVIVDVIGQGEAYTPATVEALTTDATGVQHDVSFKVRYDRGNWQVCDRPFI